MDEDKHTYSLWRSTLVATLNGLLDQGKIVKVVSLSRKMPRLLSFMADTVFSESERKELTDVLDKCEYITEHAIPFAFTGIDIDNVEVVILDDIRLTGSTLSEACDEVFALTGKKPKYLNLFAFEGCGMITNGKEITFGTDSVRLDTIDKTKALIAEHSRIISESCLPIDVEFPIYHSNQSHLYDRLCSNLKEANKEMSYDNVANNFTQLIDDEINHFYNNDFAKIRVYRSDEGVKLASYAPNMLGEEEVSNNTFFTSDDYKDIWQTVLDSVIEQQPVESFADIIIDNQSFVNNKLNHRRMRSLIVLANYLLSVSMLVRQKHAVLGGDIDAYELQLRFADLQMLTGKTLAHKIFDRINALFLNGSASAAIRREIPLPDRVLPPDYAASHYITQLIAVQESKSLREAVKTIFEIGYNMRNSMKKNNKSLNMKHDLLSFMESYESLFGMPRAFFKGADAKVAINETIDDMIDRGAVIPVYESVKNRNGAWYWRRFFRASHTIASYPSR